MSPLFRSTLTVCRYEFMGYFITPIALVLAVIFLLISGLLTFYVGNFLERDQADLNIFFNFVPWLFLFLIPAIGMRLWSEERRSGSIELLLTLPIPLAGAVLGKFFAAWLLIGLILVLTFPLWITVNYLGTPDNGVIAAGYIGVWLMAGAYLSVTSSLSGISKNQIISFVISIAVCFLFTISGTTIVLNFFTALDMPWLVNAVSNTSFLTHFNSISRGVLDIRDIIFFVSISALWLFISCIIIEHYKEK